MAINPAPRNTTARTIIRMALRDSGYLALGQSPSAEVVNEAFIRLNWILDLWATKRWMTWHLVDIAATSHGQQFFTVGVGGDFPYASDFNTDFNPDFGSSQPYGLSRPMQVEKAYSRLLTSAPAIPVDYPLSRIASYEDYAEIRLKTQSNFPTSYFYDPAIPLGKVYFWPIPLPDQFEMHIIVRNPLYNFISLDDTVVFPTEYIPALELALAVWLRTAAKMPPDPALNALAKNALNSIRVNNTQVPNLRMPGGLARPSIYNILSDERH